MSSDGKNKLLLVWAFKASQIHVFKISAVIVITGRGCGPVTSDDLKKIQFHMGNLGNWIRL